MKDEATSSVFITSTKLKCASNLLGTVGVEELVGGLEADGPSAAGEVDDTIGGDVQEGLLNLSGGEAGRSAQDDGGSASNVGRGHAGARDGVVRGTGREATEIDPGSLDQLARGGDINAGTEVGERGTLILLVASGGLDNGGGSHSDGGGLAGRAPGASIGVLVTGSDGEGDASLHGSYKQRGKR